jgi:hypothetical protein
MHAVQGLIQAHKSADEAGVTGLPQPEGRFADLNGVGVGASIRLLPCAKVAEEEARLNELRARPRAGKERQVHISERTLQEWQRTMDGRKIPIPQTKKRRRKQLRKHNGRLAPGKGCVASYSPTSLLYLLPPLVPPPTPLAQALRRALVQLHRRPW